MGKLYINYPMMQSYKHFKALPDPDFLQRTATPRGYKELVGKESLFTDLSKYEYKTFASIALHNLSKTWKILDYTANLPTKEEFTHINWTHIFDKELIKFSTTHEVDVLNTLIFFIIHYNPTNFFRSVERHPEKYDFIF